MNSPLLAPNSPADNNSSDNTSWFARALHEWKILAKLGAPIWVAQMAQMANGVVDTIMAGHASALDLAGVAIGLSIWAPLLLFFYGTLSALQPTISNQNGARQFARIVPTTWQGLYITAVATVVMILALVNVEPLLKILSMNNTGANITKGYLDAFAWGVPALLCLNALRGLTDGLGHTRVIMVFSLLSTLINVPLNWLFIYGGHIAGFDIPALGGIGCGWATALSNWIALGSLLMYLNFSKGFADFHLLSGWSAPDSQQIVFLLKLGLPIGLTMFVEVSMFCVIALFLAPLGSASVAGHQIVLNVTSVFFMAPLSLGMALTLRVSYLLGARDFAEARLLARSSLLLALGVSSVNMLILFIGRDFIPTLYTEDAPARAVARQLIVLAAVFQIADAVQVTMINVLRGYSDTKVPLLIMLLSFWVVCLPLGYVLTFTDWLHSPMGAAGFWTALIVGLACAATLLTRRVFRFKYHED